MHDRARYPENDSVKHGRQIQNEYLTYTCAVPFIPVSWSEENVATISFVPALLGVKEAETLTVSPASMGFLDKVRNNLVKFCVLKKLQRVWDIVT